MQLIDEKDKCCGCEACSAVCPTKAISIIRDSEGFCYPQIDNEKCVDCGACLNKCAFQNALKGNNEFAVPYQKLYAVKHRNLETRMESRSGGIFTAISDLILAEGGVIYGAVFDETDKTVKHIRAEDAFSRNKMRGSKYVQSKLSADVYNSVKSDLVSGKPVMYTGTSCQIAALRTFLGKDYENLLCMDIVCHGVPSPRVLSDYLSYYEKKLKDGITVVDFRNKKSYGWAGHVETLFTKSGKKTDSGLYTALFYEHNVLRPSCYVCPYKSLSHPGDITIADYWGIDRALPGFSDNKGVSLVLVNTDKGMGFFMRAKTEETIEAVETDIEKSMQPPLQRPFPRPEGRQKFWDEYDANGFEYIAEKYSGKSKKLIFKYRVKKILMDLNLYKQTR